MKALNDPTVKQQFAALGADPVSSTPAALADLIKSETAKWAKVVKASGASVD